MTTPDSVRSSLSDYGLSDTNTVINRDRLSHALSGLPKPIREGIIKCLLDNPDRDKDKRPIMKKTGKESNIKETTGQGLGSVIDNMPYYVDSCAWWINGWNPDKYKVSIKRAIKANRKHYIDSTKLNREGEVITRRRRVARKALKTKD